MSSLIWSDSSCSFSEYCAYVRDVLHCQYASTWLVAAKKHNVPVQYKRILPCTPDVLKRSLACSFSWATLLGQRCVARLRCDLVNLGHCNQRVSCASVQSCIFCGCASSALWAHVFGACPYWGQLRFSTLASLGLSLDSRPWDFMYHVVSADPGNSGYEFCVAFVAAIVKEADSFWVKTGS